MEQGIFNYFCTETEGFVFSTEENDIPSDISGTPHEREVKKLITDIRGMAVNKSFKLPESFAADCSREDWIQLALITMFQCCEKYDRKRPFDNYVRFMVSRKLADKQRTLLRKNPPANREILDIFNEMKKKHGDNEAIARLAKSMNRSVQELQEIIGDGVGPRVFTSETDEISRTSIDEKTPSPEDEADTRERMYILKQCLEKLSQKPRSLFVRHVVEEVSFKKLFIESCCSKSLASFKRWYQNEIQGRIQKCVMART